MRKTLFVLMSLYDKISLIFYPELTSNPYQPMGGMEKEKSFTVDMVIVEERKEVE